MAKIGPRKLSWSISSLGIFQDEAQDVAKIVKKAFLVKSLAKRFQDEAQDVAKIGSRKLSW